MTTFEKEFHKQFNKMTSQYETVPLSEAEPYWAKRKQVLLARSQALVIAMVGKELSEQWWTTTNKAFEGHSPVEIFERHPEYVYNYLMRIAEGEW